MPDVPHGMLEKLNFVRQMGDRSCANAIDVDIGPPNMRYVSHGILEKLNTMVEGTNFATLEQHVFIK